MPETPKNKRQNEAVDYNVAMGRLMYVVAIGAFFIFVYGLRQKSGGVISVGMMTAGASLLAGGLLGFLFGVPHTRAESTSINSEDASDGDEDKASKTEAALSGAYRPSTSLEQISDWLTKILVGVGLVDVRDIVAKVLRMADYIAPGLSGDGSAQQSARIFGLTILVYFSICGFVFGFLWARLYLPRWFAEADQVKRLLSQFELQMQADAQALGLFDRLLTATANSDPIDDEEVAAAMRKASTPVKAQVFFQAEAASDDKQNPNYQARLKTAVAIFKGLAADDVEQKYHRNYSELSHAFGRLRPPNWEEARKAIEKAIEIRDRLHLKGWQYYEFRRARTLIESNSEFAHNTRSDPAVVEEVKRCLLVASRRPDRLEGWLSEGDAIVRRWMKLNDVIIPPPS